ncbi:MAG TPA: AAA family ATPase [Thermoanaerobaculia bacterium]|nr:AAA family ATPase [Thermoanaerobaculia bacterium]
MTQPPEPLAHPRTFDRSDPETAREVFEKLYPDSKTRRRLLEILADSIERAHAVNPASWSVTLGFNRRHAVLNVGRVFALYFEPRKVSLILSNQSGELPERLHKDFPTERSGALAALPGVAWFRLTAEELLTRWDELREDHLQTVERAAGKVRRTPYYRSFSPAVVRLAERVVGRKLPEPRHQEEAAMQGKLAEGVVALVRKAYPDWDGFDHPKFVKDELGYKRAAAEKARELLSEDQLRELISQERFDEILERLKKVGHATNLLYLGVPSSGDLAVLHAERLDLPPFCAAVLDLLYGPGESPERLERFTSYLAEKNLPNKWTFPTYLLFFLFPESDFFVKPGVTSWFLKLAEASDIYTPRPGGDAYDQILAHVRALGADLEPYGARDMINVQSALWVAHSVAQEIEKAHPSGAKRREMESLFEEFVRTYLTSPQGQEHEAAYERGREQARRSFAEIVAARDAGDDVTERVLLKFLPYVDTSPNREKGAWTHVAPAITGDLKGWFEAVGWRQSGDWEEVAQAILRFVERSVNDPTDLEVACTEFAKKGWSTGFQTGMLTPILNALRPDDFLLVNNKSRRLINYLSGKSLSQKLVDFPELNRIGQGLVEDLSDLLATAPTDARSEDIFDAFSHWLTTIRKFSFGKPQYWKIAPGEEAKYWADCLVGGFISIGWNDLGDLSKLSREEFERRRDRLASEQEGWTREAVEQVWKFAKDIREGDKILANQGTGRILGFGTVTGPYEYVPNVPHSHRLSVDWDDIHPREVQEGGWRRTLISLDREKFMALIALPPIDKPGPPHPDFQVQPLFPIPDCAAELRMDPADIERWVRAIERKKQAILYGPPGTGKTYAAEALARHLIGGGNGFTELVQFHPSYAYEDFIQGIRPEPLPDGGLDYPVKAGRFLEFCSRAKECEGRCVLVIDEINRTNLSRVFGELMYLLEYRGKAIPLASGGELFSIPENVRILGAMNTADRSIALVDHALRRRFAFLELRPSYETLRRFHEGNGHDVEPLIELLREVNAAIADPHYEVGITYFLLEDLPTQLEDIWTMEVLPYLEEYFFDQRDKVDRFRWEAVRGKLAP